MEMGIAIGTPVAYVLAVAVVQDRQVEHMGSPVLVYVPAMPHKRMVGTVFRMLTELEVMFITVVVAEQKGQHTHPVELIIMEAQVEVDGEHTGRKQHQQELLTLVEVVEAALQVLL